MNEKINEESDRDEYLFQHLIAMFQSLALQQLGKLINPISGEVEGNLQQAKITIDMLVMIQKKTEGNLTEGEKQLLDRVIMELQMNFVESLKTKKVEEEENTETEEKEEEKGDEEKPKAGNKSKKEPNDKKKHDN